jgi:K+-transporting ATPase ATPase C chain
MSEKAVREVITRYTTGKLLSLWGEPGVNVLKVNLALDGRI